jgi:hypothetical protein
MTTEQINEAKKLVEAFRPRTVEDLRSLTIPLPGPGARNCLAMT